MYWVLLILVLLSGCATGPQTPVPGLSESDLLGGFCSSSAPVDSTIFSSPPLRPAQQNPGLPVETPLSLRSEGISQIMGVTGLIQQIGQLKTKDAQGMEGARERWVEARQQLSNRVLLTMLEVSSVTAEADCEQTRAQHIATALSADLIKRVQRKTLYAILGDAMIGILGGALSLGGSTTAAAASDVFGGVITTSFGLSAAFDDNEATFQHERNLLRDIWNGPKESTLFPAPVWRFLNSPEEDKGDGKTTRRELLVADWRKHEWLGEPQSETEQKRVALFFGDGGTYSVEEFQIRAQMLGFLKTYVNLMNQHLNGLIREVLSSTDSA